MLDLKEYSLLSSIRRYEKLFGRYRKFGFVKSSGSLQSKRVSKLVEKGYLEVVNGEVILSKKGQNYERG